MEQQITLTLSDTLLKRAAGLAAAVSRPIEKILAETLEMALPDVGAEKLPSVASLSDEEVLALSQARMENKQSSRLSVLLDKQQAGALTERERAELYSLYQNYQRLWLHQSEALAEAVRRGLRQPLSA
ncbi:hypothetical protein L0337_18785 [candidate division KSB1 bacterium]|nr:hypothetical protein [candidate division KSB1 bacterium]